MVIPGQLSQAIRKTVRATRKSSPDCLQPGCRLNMADRIKGTPFYPCNVAGSPVRVAPTFVSYVGSHAFRNKGPGMVQDLANGQWTEPLHIERERAMIFPEHITSTTGLKERDRHKLLGQVMDPTW